MKKVTWYLICTFTLCLSYVNISYSQKIEIVRNGNLRSGPSTQNEIIGKVTTGMKVMQLENKNDWYNVKLPDQKTGWIHKILIDKARNLDEVDNKDTNVKSDQFFAISEIKPVGTSLFESKLKPSSISGHADQSASHSGHDRKFISKACCFYEDPDNRILAALKGDFPIGQSATKLCEEISSSETTINSSYMVWQTEYGGLVLSTENEEDKLYYYFQGDRMVRIPPFGDGAIISFKGKVVDFFEGYTFEGTEVNPLRFELSSKTGLTYISGNGSILKGNRLLKEF